MQREKTESLETPVIEMTEPSWQAIATTSSSTTNEEDNTIFTVWEEDYQDLSDWCMDAFQGQCAFLTGESGATRHSGTKIEGKIVSKPAVEVERVHLADRVEERGETMEEESDDRGDDTINTQMIHQYKIPKEEKVEELADVWLDQPKTSIALRTDEWIQMIDKERIDEPFQKDWDVVTGFDNTGLNSFDLLSYLCDDNIQSPDGSVSTDSASVQANPNDQFTFSSSKSGNITNKPETVTPSSLSNNSNKSSSAIVEEPKASSSSRSTRVSRVGAVKKVKIEPTYGRSSKGKKRSIESDSDDRMSDCSSYRESREKNNEASRKSRQNKKAKETEMMAKAMQLEKDNGMLKIKVEQLEKMVTSMRAAILRSAMRRGAV